MDQDSPKPIEDFPPAYNEATGTLDLQQEGLNAQTQIRSQCIVLPFCGKWTDRRQQTTGVLTYISTRPTRNWQSSFNGFN
jgi:hypothetical protein